MSKLLLEINNLSKRYCRDPKRAASYAMRDIWNDVRRLENRDYLRPGEFWAVRDVSLDVAAGEVVGLIGHNGAGKSTLINLAASVLRPTLGSITLHTNRVVLMDHQGGLSPVQTGRENIGTQLSLHGMPESEIAERLEEVAAYSELGDFVNAPVGTYSLGMKVRLAFAIYSRLKPDLFIVDEALNGGDIRFRNKFLRFLTEYIAGGGSILVASHDLFTVQSLCDRCILMDMGKVHAVGTAQEVIYTYNMLAQGKDQSVVIDTAALEAETRFVDSLLDVKELKEVKEVKEGPEVVAPLSDEEQTEAPSTYPVRFHSIEVMEADGGLIYPGSAVRVRIVCETSEVGEVVLWSLEIGTSEVFPLATIPGGYDVRGYVLRAGLNEFECCIEKLPLVPGLYEMCVYVVTHNGGVLLGMKGHDNDRIKFEVSYQPDPGMNMSMYRKNLVYIGSAWTQQIDTADPRIGAREESADRDRGQVLVER